MSKRISAALAVLLIVGVLAPAAGGATLETRYPRQRALPKLSAAPDDALFKALDGGRLTEAQYALQRARSLFELNKVRKDFGEVKRLDPRSATLVLRDLAIRRSELTGKDAAAAKRILARPTTPGEGEPGDYEGAPSDSTCTATFCVHWATSGPNAPDVTDGDANGLPDWVDDTVAELEFLIPGYIDMGYRAVKSDLTSPDNGGSGLPDIYVAEIGDKNLYGYCTTDDPNTEGGYQGFDFSAYCVVDNDYDGFPANTPLQNLQVTLAHEYFHAVQFAYDAGEDTWFMESSAAWVEDVMYDDINDNYQYLVQSAISYSDFPIDFWDEQDFNTMLYGGWLYLRFLTEYLGDGTTHDFDFIKRVWERLSARPGELATENFSVEGIDNELAVGGFDFADVFGDFAMFNWAAELFYEEGSAFLQWLADHGQPTQPYVSDLIKLTSKKKKSGRRELQAGTPHLATTNVVFKPGKGVTNSAKIVVKAETGAQNKNPSPEIRYVIFYKNGLPDFGQLEPNGKGIAKKKLAFGKKKVSYVALAMVNASREYNCWVDPGSPYSCLGSPKHDNAPFVWSGVLKQ